MILVVSWAAIVDRSRSKQAAKRYNDDVDRWLRRLLVAADLASFVHAAPAVWHRRGLKNYQE